MNRIQGREPLSVVPPKVSVETLVGIDAQELAHHFDGEYFGVGELDYLAAVGNRRPGYRQTPPLARAHEAQLYEYITGAVVMYMVALLIGVATLYLAHVTEQRF